MDGWQPQNMMAHLFVFMIEDISIYPPVKRYFLCYEDYIKIQADRLIIRDSGFYRNYFKDLDTHTPK